MSQPNVGVPPFRVVYSGACREEVRNVLQRAVAKGRSAEIGRAIADIDTRLKWIPLDFGEPLRDYLDLELQELVGMVQPFVVTYAVDESRRLVYVLIPFKLLPNSGL